MMVSAPRNATSWTLVIRPPLRFTSQHARVHMMLCRIIDGWHRHIATRLVFPRFVCRRLAVPGNKKQTEVLVAFLKQLHIAALAFMMFCCGYLKIPWRACPALSSKWSGSWWGVGNP